MKIALALMMLPAAALAGCATLQPTQAQMDECRQMQERMATADRHDHAETKGKASTEMERMHARCRQMMASAET